MSKDPKRPKDPQSAYVLFCADPLVNEKVKELNFSEKATQKGVLWKALTPEEKEVRSRDHLHQYMGHQLLCARMGGLFAYA